MCSKGVLLLSKSFNLNKENLLENDFLERSKDISDIAIMLSDWGTCVHLMVAEEGIPLTSLDEIYRDYKFSYSSFPIQQPIDLTMSFSLASGTFGASPYAMTTTLPLEGSLFMNENFNKNFSSYHFLVIPRLLLGTPMGDDISLSAMKIAEYHKIDLIYWGANINSIDNKAEKNTFNSLLSNLKMLCLTKSDCQFFFDREVNSLEDAYFLCSIGIPYIWIDLEEKGQLFIKGGSVYVFWDSYLANKKNISYSTLRNIIFSLLIFYNQEKSSDLFDSLSKIKKLSSSYNSNDSNSLKDLPKNKGFFEFFKKFF